ncbi:MAG: hypothetical protein DWQ07_21515 [Chloroflexi bacterium]|nr:MAG: hypothetical protein DWQ07_21515 [Chloroflexota bacterium]MBL1196599.1 hypothetical protein [Chloroflexota bacterium]NOH13894.1 hypothetical protein [Chloroflexota bacterium]
MRISNFKIYWRFLIPWVFIGFIGGLGLFLPEISDLDFRLQFLFIGIVVLTLRYFLLVRYFKRASLFILLGLIWTVLGVYGGDLLESLISIFLVNIEQGNSPPNLFGLSLGYFLSLGIAEWLVLRMEFEKAYLWILAVILGLVISGLYEFTFFSFVGMVLISAAYFGASPLAFLLFLFSPSVVSATITGLFLGYILNNPKDNQQSNSSTLETI